VAEDFLDHLVVINKGNQFHFSTAVWADERIDFRDLFDELAPLFRRDVRRVVLGRMYWYALYPLHQLVFAGMVRGIVDKAVNASRKVGREEGRFKSEAPPINLLGTA